MKEIVESGWWTSSALAGAGTEPHRDLLCEHLAKESRSAYTEAAFGHEMASACTAAGPHQGPLEITSRPLYGLCGEEGGLD